MTSSCGIFGILSNLNLEIKQLDVKTAFLHDDLEEEIYMEHLQGFEETDKRETSVFVLERVCMG